MYNSLLYFAALINQNTAKIPSASGFSLNNVLNTAYLWAGAIAVIVIVIGGFYYVLSLNNAQRVARAKNAILSATIGLVVVLMAFAITNIVIKGVSG